MRVSMKQKIVISLALLVIVGLFGGIFYLLKHQQAEKNYLQIYGNVDIRQVDLGFRVFGRVQEVFVDEGDEVQPKQLLAILDKVPYEESLSLYKAKVKEMEMALEKTKAKFQKRDQVDPQAISQEDYDDAFYNFEEMNANLEASIAQLEIATTNVDDTHLYSPTFGSVLTRIREPGSVLNPGDPVFTVSIASPVWIRTYVSERELGRIYPGMRADIITDTTELKMYHGQIGFISPVAEFTPKTVESTSLRTELVYRLRVIVEDPNRELKQGMPVTIRLKF